MIRLLLMIGAFCGAIGMSQFPEFSQQYLQRLSGAVDELRNVVLAFDAAAAKSGITRAEALEELQGSAFQSELSYNLAGQIDRYERLSADYQTLKEAEPLQRLTQVHRFADTELVRRTWQDFRPAVPVTVDGFICAAIGFGISYILILLMFTGMRRLFRRSRADQVA